MKQVGFDTSIQGLSSEKLAFGCSIAFHVIPHQFVRIQFGSVLGLIMQFQPLLLTRQQERSSPLFFRTQQTTHAVTVTSNLSQPFIYGCTAESIRSNHLSWRVPFPHSFNRHQSNCFQRLVIKCTSVSLHTSKTFRASSRLAFW